MFVQGAFFWFIADYRETRADFEEEVFPVAVPVNPALDDFDGVADALDDTGIERVPTRARMPCQ